MAISIIKSKDIEMLRNSGLAVAKTLYYLEQNIKAGMSLLEVDQMGEEYLNSLGYRAAFKGLYGFPNAICTSLNNVIIHSGNASFDSSYETYIKGNWINHGGTVVD